jgi:hypothetical protein
MKKELVHDLQRFKGRAYHMAEWAGDVLGQYHAALPRLSDASIRQIQPLYNWLFVPPTLWPFNVADVLANCLTMLEKKKRWNLRQRLLMVLLPEPPHESICAAVAEHEHQVQKGTYENLFKTQAKYTQNEMAISIDSELSQQWKRIKTTFDVKAYQDHKGVIRRTMAVERNFRTTFHVNLHQRDEVFRAAFDAFCLRWNLYGMQHDTPLLLKLAVNITPYGTLIHIPAYWSFDPKRDIRWEAIAKLHRVRVAGRQGAALADGYAQRMKDAEKLRRLDKEAAGRGLKGDKKHEFLCAGLGWVAGTSPKRLARLRAEFNKR